LRPKNAWAITGPCALLVICPLALKQQTYKENLHEGTPASATTEAGVVCERPLEKPVELPKKIGSIHTNNCQGFLTVAAPQTQDSCSRENKQH
jgi:hypothetical protein